MKKKVDTQISEQLLFCSKMLLMSVRNVSVTNGNAFLYLVKNMLNKYIHPKNGESNYEIQNQYK